MNHLRHANASPETQHAALLSIVRASPALMAAFRTARDLDLPDWSSNRGCQTFSAFFSVPVSGSSPWSALEKPPTT